MSRLLTCLNLARRPWGHCVLSGLLLTLAFPCHPEHALAWLYGPAWAWIALTPLLLAVGDARGIGVAFRQGWLTGFVFHLLSLYWVAHTQGGGPAVVGGTGLMASYLALFTGAFAAGLRFVVGRVGARGLLAAPLLWTAAEYLLSVGELGFPWLLLGHSQAPLPALIQVAEYTGVYGVTFAVCASNALLAGALAQPGQRQRLLAGAAIVPALLAVYGALVIEPEGPGTRDPAPLIAAPRIAVVQNNMGLSKWRPNGLATSLASLEMLSRRALSEAPDLIVWPETAVPCNLSRRAECRDRVHKLAIDLDTPILTGAPSTNTDTGEPLNGAFLFRPHTWQVLTYAKMHLVPFGERTPLRDSLPLLRDIDWSVLTGDLAPAEFARGQERTLFPLTSAAADTTHFAVLICFESVFPDFVRRSVGAGADLLVNITNDSWFGPTAGPYQHADLAVLRAVENRVAIARCATSGVSLFIDRFGRTRQHTELGTADVRVAALAPRTGTTLYTRHGDWFAIAVLLSSLLSLVALRCLPSPVSKA